MHLRMPQDLAISYRSGAQRARIVSEAWGERNLYCANCSSDRLNRCAHNTRAIDYFCPKCQAPFQLKSCGTVFGQRIVDGAFSAMQAAIHEGRTPNLLLLHYEPLRWQVRNLLLLPHFAFTLSCLQKRKPLTERARRAGWIGCNILLTNIPTDARIDVVRDGVSSSPSVVRKQFASLKPLSELEAPQRGWTLDVLRVVRSLGKRFDLSEVYASEEELRSLHPGNYHVKEKIRQQLQMLRNLGILKFIGRGQYELQS